MAREGGDSLERDRAERERRGSSRERDYHHRPSSSSSSSRDRYSPPREDERKRKYPERDEDRDVYERDEEAKRRKNVCYKCGGEALANTTITTTTIARRARAMHLPDPFCD